MAVAFVAFGAGFVAHKVSQEYKAQKLSAASKNNSENRYVDQFAALGRNKPIVMLGDSRMAEGAWAEWLGRPVSVRGIGGEKLPQTILRVEKSIPTRAKVVFVQVGINDVQSGAPNDAILQNYRDLLSRLKPRATRVVVCAITQVGASAPGAAQQVAKLNPSLRDLVKKSGAEWLDINPLVCANGYIKPEFTADGIHATGALYKVQSAAVKAELKRLKI